MPDLGGLISRLIGFIGEVVGSSTLRLGLPATIGVLAIALLLLSLVARPASRWSPGDLGGLRSVRRAMALAAESGGVAAVSLGTAGVSRSTGAFERLATLTVLPLLGHVVRGAARGGVPLDITTNDPIAAALADGVVADAHQRTATPERATRSDVRYIGEGRVTAAGRAVAAASAGGTTFVLGDLAAEGPILIDALAADASSTTLGTAAAAIAGQVILEGHGRLIGPELFLASSDLATGGVERAAALTVNRLILVAALALVAGAVLDGLGVIDVASLLAVGR